MIFEHAATWAAVLGAIAYGSGDFIGGRASRRLGTMSAVAIAQAVAVAFLLQDYALAQGPLPLGTRAWASVAAGVAYAIGVISLYEGLGHGRIAIVASICGLLSILVPLAGDLVLGRNISHNEMVGMIFCAAATVLIVGTSRAYGARRSISWSVRIGAASGIGFGISDLSLGTMPPELATGALLMTRSIAATIAVALAFGLVGRISSNATALRFSTPAAALATVAEPSGLNGAQTQPITVSLGLKASVALAMVAGVLDTLGHVGYVHAATRGSMGVAAALVAIFPAVTVLLAAIVLRERITLPQLAGFGLGAGGIIFISG